MNYHSDLIVTGLRAYKVLEISQVVSQAAVIQGLDVKTAEFTNEPIMSTETAYIRIGKKISSPLALRGKVNILACFEPVLAINLAIDYLSPNGLIIMNTNSILRFISQPNEVISLFEQLAEKVVKLDVFQIAREAGDINKNNFVLLGALSKLRILPISQSNIIKAIELIMIQRDIGSYIKALELGRQAVLTSFENGYIKRNY